TRTPVTPIRSTAPRYAVCSCGAIGISLQPVDVGAQQSGVQGGKGLGQIARQGVGPGACAAGGGTAALGAQRSDDLFDQVQLPFGTVAHRAQMTFVDAVVGQLVSQLGDLDGS